MSFQKQIDYYVASLSTPISTEWTSFANIKYKLSQAQSQLRKNKTNAKELRKQQLMQRASAMNISNKMTSSSTIINIQKIEQVIIMWHKINYLTADNKNSSLQTIDIPIDKTIEWNDIKQTPNLLFKTVDDPEIMEQVIAERNSHHLNQAQGTPLTIEPLLSLIGTDSFTSFSQELLNETANLSPLTLSPTIKKYLKKLKQNKEIVSTKTNNNIPFNEYKKGFKKWKESTTTSPSGKYLGHHHSLLAPDGTQYNKDKENFSDRM